MIIPREKPYFEDLNGYYLKLERFVGHMQVEIRSGCVYCRSSSQELLIYFNEYEIIRCIVQDRGQPARSRSNLNELIDAFGKKPFFVSVHYLDLNAVYFWAQIPPFQTKLTTEETRNISFPDFVKQYTDRQFSGFIDVRFKSGQSGLLFFKQGNRTGGSYSWGHGGLSPWEKDYQSLLYLLEKERSNIKVGQFAIESDPMIVPQTNVAPIRATA